MSALLIDQPVATPQRWVHVPRPPAPARRPLPSSAPARPALRRGPGGRPGGVGAPRLRLVPATSPSQVAPAGGQLRLTRRGLAVAVVGFLALMAVSLVVVVAGFLSVSNDPIGASGGEVATVATR